MADVQLSTLGSIIKTAYEAEADTNAFTDAEKTKLTNIETAADVTDTANVTAAGALMDSEVTNLAAVKAFDPTDYATAAQGATADTAVQPGDDAAGLGSAAATDGYVLTADGAGGAAWEAGGAGSSAASDLTWSGGTQSEVADGASAVAFNFDTDAAYSTSGAKLLSLKNNATDRVFFDYEGALTIAAPVVSPNKKLLTITVGGAERFSVDEDGDLNTVGSIISGIVRANDSSAFASSGATFFYQNGLATARDNGFNIEIVPKNADSATQILSLTGQAALPAAATNLDGGNVTITGGAGASGSAGDADGGNVVVRGGTGYGTGSTGLIIMDNLPTSDPAVAGALWSNAGVLTVSSG